MNFLKFSIGLCHLQIETVLSLPFQSESVLFLSCLTVLDRPSSIMLHRNGESRQSCLVPDLSGGSIHFLTAKYDAGCGFSEMSIIRLSKSSFVYRRIPLIQRSKVFCFWEVIFMPDRIVFVCLGTLGHIGRI